MNCPWKKYPDRAYQKYRHNECIPIHKLKRSRFDTGFKILKNVVLDMVCYSKKFWLKTEICAKKCWLKSNVQDSKNFKLWFDNEVGTNHTKNHQCYIPQIQERPDKILNVTFNFAVGSSINNIKFQYPTEPLYHGTSSIKECPEHHSEVPIGGIWKCSPIKPDNI